MAIVKGKSSGPLNRRPQTQFTEPDSQRGLWRFLTWPFFLAEILVAEHFVGSAARAAQDSDPASVRHNPDSPGLRNDEPAVTILKHHDEPAPSQSEPSGLPSPDLGHCEPGVLPSPDLRHTSVPDGGASSTRAEQVQSNSSSFGDAGSASGSDAPKSFSDGGASAPVNSLIAQPLSDISHTIDDSLSQLMGLQLVHDVWSVERLIGDSVENILGHVTSRPLDAHGLAPPSGLLEGDNDSAKFISEDANAAASSSGASASDDSSLDDSSRPPQSGTDDLTFAKEGERMPVSIVGDGIEVSPLHLTGVLSSPGRIAFFGSGPSHGDHLDDLFTGGRYTDYGVALQTSIKGLGHEITDTFGAVVMHTDALPHIDAPTNTHPELSVGVQHPSVIEEAGARDHPI
jgi:hypothetical protein